MDEDLISKKELLERYGISYGALKQKKRCSPSTAFQTAHSTDGSGWG